MSDLNPGIGHQATIVQISEGNGYTPLLEIHGSTLPLGDDAALYIDGVRWAVVRRRVDVETASMGVSTTVTVVPYDD